MRGYIIAAMLLIASPVNAATCMASWYGHEMHGRNADGTPWRPSGLSMAHRSLPFGTIVEVCFHGCVAAPVKDRGPAAYTGRCLDLSQGLARAIGMLSTSRVSYNVVGRNSAPRLTRRSRVQYIAPSFNLLSIFGIQ